MRCFKTHSLQDKVKHNNDFAGFCIEGCFEASFFICFHSDSSEFVFL